MNRKNFFISAIGTDSGKTIVSAILTESLSADYWKPVQAGAPKDSELVKSLISNDTTMIHPEAFTLKTPASPHYAAQLDGVLIKINDIKKPPTSNHLIIEGAGGLMVPLNQDEIMVDLATHLQSELILVINHYLGSINHSILSIKYLISNNIKVKGIIFNGSPHSPSEEVIERHCPFPVLGRVPSIEHLNKSTISRIAEEWKTKLI